MVTHDLQIVRRYQSLGSCSSNVQQTTALHNIANSKNTFDISFSSANVRLLPSKRDLISANKKLVGPQRLLTDNESEIFQLSGISLVLDCDQPPFKEILRPKCSVLVHNNLSVE